MNRYIQKNFERERRGVRQHIRALERLSYIHNEKKPRLSRIFLKVYREVLLWIYAPGFSFRRQVLCRLGFHKFSWQHYELKRFEEPGRVIICCDSCSKILGIVAFDDLPELDFLQMVAEVQDLRSRKVSTYHC